jgi:hypothetical protein
MVLEGRGQSSRFISLRIGKDGKENEPLGCIQQKLQNVSTSPQFINRSASLVCSKRCLCINRVSLHMPHSRMTAAAHGNSSTKEKVKDETIPGFSHLFSLCQHLKTAPSQKSFHL